MALNASASRSGWGGGPEQLLKIEMPEKCFFSNEEWKKRLTPEEYHVLREAGTERAFTGCYDDFYETGVYLCAACQNELFSSKDKYKSGSGWPSFTQPIDPSHVSYKEDGSRVEVRCSKCDSHLGHVFPDGPAPTGNRFCMNSVAIDFIGPDKQKPSSDKSH